MVIVHNPDFFDRNLEAVLNRSDLLLFLNCEWLRETPITIMVIRYRLSAHIRVTKIDLQKFLVSRFPKSLVKFGSCSCVNVYSFKRLKYIVKRARNDEFKGGDERLRHLRHRHLMTLSSQY